MCLKPSLSHKRFEYFQAGESANNIDGPITNVIDAGKQLDQENLADIETIVELGMIALGIIILAVAGEAAKYVMPAGILYFLLVDKVYILAAALFLLLWGISKINMNSVRNLTGLSVLVILGIVIAWQLDIIASGTLWNGIYPSVYGRIPGNDVSLSLQAIDIVAIALGALGAFLVLLKALDRVKDMLVNGSRKSVKPARIDAAAPSYDANGNIQ